MTDVKSQDIEALIRTFDDSDWDELSVKIDGLEIHLSKNPEAARAGTTFATSPADPAPASQLAPAARPASQPSSGDAGTTPTQEVPDGLLAIRAPNLGTFYRSPKPGAQPYVAVGQRVTPETEICLIEVMKLFTPVRAGVAGIVRKVLVEDAQLVEYDQPLFLIEPSA